MQPLPNPIPTNKPGVEPKRPPKPINITGLCKLSSTVPNYLNVSWAVEVGSGYTVSVYYVEKLSSSDLMDELKKKGKRNADFTRGKLSEALLHKVLSVKKIKFSNWGLGLVLNSCGFNGSLFAYYLKFTFFGVPFIIFY